jgi:hypothetical protein
MSDMLRIGRPKDGVDAAVPVDAKNASTSDLQNRKERGFAQRPHRSSSSGKKKTEERTTKQLQVCQFRLSQQKGSPQLSVPTSVPKRLPRTIIRQPTPTNEPIKNGPEIIDFRPVL